MIISKRIAKWLIYIVCTFIVFENTFANILYIHSLISLVRDGSMLILFFAFVNFGNLHYSIPSTIKLFYAYLWVIYVLSVMSTPGDFRVGLVTFYRLHELLFLFFICYVSEKKLGFNSKWILELLIILSVVKVVVDLVGHFYLVGIIFGNFQRERMTVGYATADQATLNYSLALLLMDGSLRFSKLRRLFFSIILIIGILLYFSGTGLATLAVVLLISIYANNTIISTSSTKYVTRYITIISLLLVPQVYIYAISGTNDQLYVGAKLLETKALEIVGQETDNSTNTVIVRENQYDGDSKKFNYNSIRKMFGLSINMLTRELKMIWTSKYMHCENMFSCILIGLGYVGLFIFLLIPMQLLYQIYKSGVRKDLILTIAIIIIFLFNCYTNITLIAFNNAGYFAFLYYILFKRKTIIMYHE